MREKNPPSTGRGGNFCHAVAGKPRDAFGVAQRPGAVLAARLCAGVVRRPASQEVADRKNALWEVAKIQRKRGF